MIEASAELWRRAENLFQAALDRPMEQRHGFVERAAGQDQRLLDAVHSLLKNHHTEDLILGDPQVSPSVPNAQFLGRRLGLYRLSRVLGCGGTSTVYRGERCDGDIEQEVAIKLLNHGASPAAFERFVGRERRILAQLEHPNIARFIDAGISSDNLYYLVLELVEGAPLVEYCDACALGVRERIELFQKVTAAVRYVHQHLIVHRDIKPGNILVTSAGEPKLLDFGIAKILDSLATPDPTVTEDRALTPLYASPEQLRGQPVGTSSDVYSLGVLLYQLLVGVLPFSTQGGLVAAHLALKTGAPPQRPSVAARTEDPESEDPPPAVRASMRSATPRQLGRALEGDLDNIVLRCLRPEPEQRYGSVEELAADLERYLTGMPVKARPAGFLYRTGKFVARNPMAVFSTLALALSVIGFAIAMAMQSARLASQRDLATEAQAESEQVTEFLVEAFRAGNPYSARSTSTEDVTVSQVLEYSAGRISEEFHQQPRIRAKLLRTLGRVYGDLGLSEKAVQVLEEAVAIHRTEVGEDLQLAEYLSKLGAFYHREGRLETASEVLRESVLLAQQYASPEEAGPLGDCLFQLGQFLRVQGNLDEAEPLLVEALKLYRNTEDAELAIASATVQLSLVRSAQRDFSSSVNLLKETLARLLPRYERHPELANVRFFLGRALAEQAHFEASERQFREALSINREVLGQEHPETISILGELGRLLTLKGDFDAAETVLLETLELDRHTKGDRHPDIASDLNNLGFIAWDRGDLESAEERFREALELAEEIWGEEHFRVATYLHNLGGVLKDRLEFASSEPLLRRALGLRENLFGVQSRDVGNTKVALADLLVRSGRPEEGGDLAREAIRVFSEILTPGHWRIRLAQGVLGDSLSLRGEFEEAEPLLLRSYEEMKAARGEESYEARTALDRLVRLYDSWNRPADAEIFRNLQGSSGTLDS